MIPTPSIPATMKLMWPMSNHNTGGGIDEDQALSVKNGPGHELIQKHQDDFDGEQGRQGDAEQGLEH